MSEVLYEVSYQFDWDLYTPLIMLVMIPLFVVREKVRYGRSTPVGAKIFLAVIWCIILAVAIFVGKHQLDMYNTVIGAYKSGEYQVVEGYVENFDPMPEEGHKDESFDINGVHFSYSDSSVITGYHNAKSHGGVITGDGQYLRIGYVYYNSAYGNIIVYIQELDPPS